MRTFRFFQPIAPIGYGEVNRGDFGVFFLKTAPTGYEVLDPKHPSVVAAPEARVADVDLLDQVIQEVAHVLDSHEQSTRDRWIHLEAVQVLESLRTTSATAALHVAAEDKDPLPRTWAIAALVERGDLTALAAAKEMGRSPGGNVDQNLLTRVASALWVVNDPRAIPTLTDLLLSPNLEMRRGAAAALRNTRDQAAIDPLLGALADKDDEVAYQAAFGLAEITGDLQHGPGPMDDFKKDRQKYVSYWQSWAESRR